VIITKLQVEPVEPVELVVSSESSCALRLAPHSQNAWARHVECVESSRVEPSGIWAFMSLIRCSATGHSHSDKKAARTKRWLQSRTIYQRLQWCTEKIERDLDRHLGSIIKTVVWNSCTERQTEMLQLDLIS